MHIVALGFQFPCKLDTYFRWLMARCIRSEERSCCHYRPPLRNEQSAVSVC